MPLERGMPRAPSIYGGCRLSITSIPTPPIMRCASIRPYIACLRGGYIVSRYADCVALYRDTSAFSSDKKREFAPKYGDSLLYEHHTTSLVFNAGHETTTNLIGNGLFALVQWPEEKARLLAEPAPIRPGVEELLRFESSNQLG